MGIAPAQGHAASETVLHNFASQPNGANPGAGVIRDSAGNLYGTTMSGGTTNAGVVFRVDASGHQTVLYNFTGGADGGTPYAGVICDRDGHLYGTTHFGGAAGFGVVYKLDAAGHQTVLYSFSGGTDGGFPAAGVIRDSAGNLYGTTVNGGAAGYGTVYMLDAAGQETVLYSFTGGTDGGFPYSGLMRDAAGNLYGTTTSRGTAGGGVVYKLDTAGQQTVLYNFTGGADGGYPYAGVIRDTAGNLYGTTYNGGTMKLGVVYKLDAAGDETVLYNFRGGPDGASPQGGVIRDPAGNLYGTTVHGGAAGAGVVYKLAASGDEAVLYSFTGAADGSQPDAGVIRDSAGNLYGTTAYGGVANVGVVYQLDPAGHETVPYNFPDAAGGSYPNAGVVRDSAGNLYGATFHGGPANAGVVYRLDPAGRETVLYSFTGGADGAGPMAGVIHDTEGNLYGTTTAGGAAGWGVVYKLDATGHETVLYSFTGGTDGGYPVAGVIRDPAGNLYGTTFSGGAASEGVVYKLDPSGHETVLYSFTGTDGAQPYSGVIRDSAGNLYGTTGGGGRTGAGVVYELNAAGQQTVLYRFTGQADGEYPFAGVIRDSTGNLYGTTYRGGAANAGVVYKLDPAGHETVLYSFSGGADGGQPNAGVIGDAAGNLYGTATYGGASGAGVVYKLDAAGHETVLYSFTGGIDGGGPEAGVIGDGAGNLYGTAVRGGKESSGVVFELTPQ